MTESNYTVLRNDIVGRYAVASKKLDSGDLIISELPFAVGPKIDSPPVCLSCYTTVDGSYKCSSCGWPVCNAKCETFPTHAEAECQVFRNAAVSWQTPDDFTVPSLQYECITPLRMLLASEKFPERWEREVNVLMSHNEEREQRPFWHVEHVNVVEFLRERCGLRDRFPGQLIHHVCGILEVNAYEARSTSDTNVRALYPQLAIISHSCVPNVSHSIVAGPTVDKNADFRVLVRAAVSIEAGAELFSCYTYVLAPTLTRRAYILENKYFPCNCPRCSDPTELGTHLSSLKCAKCENGVILSTKPLDPAAMWKCTHCGFTTRGAAVQKVVDTLQAEIDAIDEFGLSPHGIELREQLARKYRSVVHPRHSVQTGIRQALSQMYGRTPGYLIEDLPDLLLERKVELCQQVLDVLDVVEPGYTRLRGLTLYEMHAPMIYLARNLYQAGVIDEPLLRSKLLDATTVLEKASIILSLEDPNSPEGSIGNIAAQSLERFRNNMDSMIASL